MRDTNKNNTCEIPLCGEFTRNELTDANWKRLLLYSEVALILLK